MCRREWDQLTFIITFSTGSSLFSKAVAAKPEAGLGGR